MPYTSQYDMMMADTFEFGAEPIYAIFGATSEQRASPYSYQVEGSLDGPSALSSLGSTLSFDGRPTDPGDWWDFGPPSTIPTYSTDVIVRSGDNNYSVQDVLNVFDDIRNRPYDTSTFPKDVHDFTFNMIADLVTNPNLADDFVKFMNQEGIWTHWDRQAFNESVAAAEAEGAFDRYRDAAARYDAGDPNWNGPDPVDLLEGVDFFPDGNGGDYGGFAGNDWGYSGGGGWGGGASVYGNWGGNGWDAGGIGGGTDWAGNDWQNSNLENTWQVADSFGYA